ncbi:putative glutamine synthetase [Rosellinia necatrix]|uniref:Putative glutamine synthetase n=1 Tax=Rosellinia necatrix TaxID=77044 RepID=A0A1S7UL05_ROSNE|nr:putative glutamine synthetase [Rosellinia necatrix]
MGPPSEMMMTLGRSGGPTEYPPGVIDAKLRDLGVKYLRVYWHDYTSSAKCRVIPIDHIRDALRESKPYSISVPRVSLGILPIDHPVPGVIGTGVYALQLDWASLKSGPAPGHLSCYANFLEADGSVAPLCPRGILTRAVDQAAAAGLTFLVGFEVEFVVLERTGHLNDKNLNNKYRTIAHDGHAWSMARALASWGAEGSFTTVVDEIITALKEAGINVEQFHAESAPGQYEIVLPPRPPLDACDTLLHTRQVIESAAARHGFRVTLHPRPFADKIGSGSHAHVSIASGSGDDPRVYERFYGGILEHFRAIFAITNSHPVSYERMVDGLWAGGRWVTWGTQNKETPLRKCKDSHWEVKVMDGLANPYLSMAALLFAGTAGAELRWGDCLIDPAKLTSQERSTLGIDKMFPGSLDEALEALQSDEVMVKLLGQDFVDRYVTVKKAETGLYESIPEESRRQWVIERY